MYFYVGFLVESQNISLSKSPVTFPILCLWGTSRICLYSLASFCLHAAGLKRYPVEFPLQSNTVLFCLSPKYIVYTLKALKTCRVPFPPRKTFAKPLFGTL